MTQNAPVLIEELDRRKAAMSPGDQQAEMAFWQAACQLAASEYDVLIVDVQHPSAFAATPDWIRDSLSAGDA